MFRPQLIALPYCVCAFLSANSALAQQPEAKFPYPEKLAYRVEWRLVTAGNAVLNMVRSGQQSWQLNVDLESAGLVSRLFKVQDKYRLSGNERLCADNVTLDAQEGKRHSESVLEFDNSRHKLIYTDKDLIKNTVEKNEMDIPACTYDITGALAELRSMRLDAGKSAFLPIITGKKLANAKIEAQAKESVTIDGKNYSTIRYEVFVFDNALYRRKGRFFIWMTDDADRIPVQFRFQMGFPIGSITLELEKREKL